MFNLSNMTVAIELPKLVEDKYNAQRKHTKKPTWKSQTFQSGHKPLHSLSVKRLTPAEMEEHKKKGIYYNCNEIFAPDHC